ncbi:hypothetical protein CANTEDRAFT_95839 [Yamadazyma tenuis ATCC 10573]|uniref:Zn(2)-C6 fungal-type domain-containing protein n=1 Tax=Candida tenuis (strain ATCC 10573 / BCRC 21748 / CBS 615 / JCM 9827 / NBRC 10315 / NRRL Y-1498 / VKM Y-70) TaxID=590646 RepID=G3BDV5_CANTC|nr:uncharacterized protein CANTEDRAFT_95839 [Yamadazyma tenuis ATCC 10573]EGV60391.1 hypothetical protein CANTEDRAFT_95839 [Yamadazyma tenuis ATCC 10573]
MSQPARKRNRKVVVCLSCRKRKNKCDRRRPCTSCIKLGLHDSCSYVVDEFSISSNPEVFYGTIYLKQDPVPEPTALASVLVSSNLYPFQILDPKDPTATIISQYWAYKFGIEKFNQTLISSSFIGLNSLSRKHLEMNYNMNNSLDYCEVESGLISIYETKQKVHPQALQRGVTYHPDPLLRTYSFLERLKKVVPSQAQLMKYQSIFFAKTHILIPIFDEVSLEEATKRIFNLENATKNKIVEVTITSKTDYAVIASSLLMLRYTYLDSIICKHFDPDLDEHVCVEIMEVVEECFNLHGIIKRPSLPLLQALLLYHFCRDISPEIQDSFLVDQTLKNQILELCYTLGLNRDPEVYTMEHMDAKTVHLRRKIWFFTYYSIACDSMMYWRVSKPLIYDYDTKFPRFKADCMNVRNATNEKKGIDGMGYAKIITKVVNESLKPAQRVNSEFRGVTLYEYANSLKIFFWNYSGSYESIHDSDVSGSFTFLKVRSFILGRMLTALLQFSAYLKLEEEGSLEESKESLIGCVFTTFDELGKVDGDSFKPKSALYLEMFTSVYNPWIIKLLYMIICISLSLLIRIKYSMLTMEEHGKDNDILYLRMKQWFRMIKVVMLKRVKSLISFSKEYAMANMLVKITLKNLNSTLGVGKTLPVDSEKAKRCRLKLCLADVERMMSSFQPPEVMHEADYLANLDVFTVSDILKSDCDCDSDSKLAVFIKYDKLWIARTLIDMYYDEEYVKHEGEAPNDLFNFDLTPSQEV